MQAVVNQTFFSMRSGKNSPVAIIRFTILRQVQ
jgi:hypothetical protein